MELTARQKNRNGWQWSVVGAVAAAAVAIPLLGPQAASATTQGSLAVIVQEHPGAGDGPERAVARLGGTVERQIALIHGFSARIPGSALTALKGARGVRAVTPDAKVTLSDMDGHDQVGDSGSLFTTANVTGAGKYWRNGYIGEGIDVAVLDSGVSPVEGLNTPGKVVNGPDLSFESQQDNLRYLDTYGHGTHMAGIIAGRDADTPSVYRTDAKYFRGIAPGARIVSVKVADRSGAADVSQVIAGIDWIVQHRNTDGLNIRVLNLSFGTDGVQDYTLDPLAYAAEAAWHKGIVVVVSGGNAGFGSAKLNNPAYDPYVLAVGATDPKGTSRYDDDDVPSWSSAGDGLRNPDLVAPGKSIVSLRVVGGGIDTQSGGGRVGSRRFFRGSGTSEAAAVVSGSAALVLSQRPWLQPDQVKAILKRSAVNLRRATQKEQGSGALDLRRTYYWRTPSLASATQTWPRSNGTGSLDAARGTQRLQQDGVPLDGERDIFGTPWDGVSWSTNLWNGTSWTGGNWNGVSWTGSSWTGSSWTGVSWSGSSWTGSSWTGSSWTGSSWTGSSWTGSSWTGSSWTGSSWTGSSWSGVGWGK